MSNLTSASGEGSGSSGNRADGFGGQGLQDPTSSGATAPMSDNSERHPTAVKRKRNLPGTPDPDAEVIALSPKTLMATNRFVCEICHKGFQRDQNLQLHRRGHNLPWKLRQRTGNEIRKRVYVCPEPSCVHHEPSRALGDLTGIKKHFCRKHGEKKWKCDKCSKRYAVQSDWKAHLKICGTREYRCDCGTFFSRRDSFITHRAFCDALAEESARVSAHRHGESQQSGGPDGGVSGPSGVTAVMSGTTSPHKADSQLSEGPTEALTSTDVSKIAMCDGISTFALTDPGIPPLSSRPKGLIGPNSSADAPTKGPRLSLWLGSGPGPGPPVGLQMMGGPRQHTRDLDPATFAMPISRGVTDGGVSGIFGSEGYDATRPDKPAAGMLPFSTVTGGMFPNVFGADNDSSGSQGASNGMAGMSSFTGAMDMGHAMSGFPFPSAGVAGGVSSWSNFGTTSAPLGSSSNYKQHQNAASAQMSATALLQKAAQMGATASSPSLFRGFALGAGDSNSGAQRPASRLDQARAGTTTLLPSSSPTYPSLRPGDPSSNSQELSSFGSSLLRQGRSNGSSGVQEFMNSLSGGGGLFGNALLGYMPSLLGSSNSPGKQHKLGERAQEFQSNLVPVRSHSHAGATQAALGGLRIGEDGVDRQTHDFLGVGRPNGTAGSTAGMGGTLSQKDLASITSLGTTMLMEPFAYQNNNLQPVGTKPQSPGNSWGSP